MREELGIRRLETRIVKYREENGDKSSSCTDSDCKKYESKIVCEDELLLYIEEEWDIIKELKNEKIVIRRTIR